MDVEFEKNKIDPNDSTYEYDVRIDFEQNESNDWDENDNSLEEL